MASAALVMTQPPAETVLTPQHVGTVVVDGATLDAAPFVEATTPQGALGGTGEGQHEDEIVEVSHEVTIAVDPLEAQLNEERQKVEAAEKAREKEEELPCIWRVHPSLRQQESEDYEPKLVCIGPLHRDNKSLQPMEQIKLSYLNDLIGRHEDNKLGNYIEEIRKWEPQARKQYAEEIGSTPDELVKMLVLDGCFIIEYFVKRIFKQTKQTAQLAGVRWGFSRLRRDLMLLENQIPFFVLVHLFQRSKIPFKGTREEPLTLMEITLAFLGVDLKRMELINVDQVRHLLHLHHICLDPKSIPDEPAAHCTYIQVASYPFKVAYILISAIVFGVLYILLIHKLPRCCCFPCTEEEEEVPRDISCATELHNSGIKFRKKEKVSSYLKVSFVEGTLEIPFLRVQESTSSELRNFIALEQCCPKVGSHFTSFAVLMDNIINTEGDVAILRKRGIIESKLGCDDEVAKMFNKLCKGTHLDYKNHYNAGLFKQVKEYSEVPHHKWRASLRATHLRSPWSTLSFVAGILIFGLAITQAYFTISRRRK
ncbi:hypothetical protein Taro_038926 [Colocasia esculenta]|uniref:Uncharacterized protein n=1 Tax=Colocasia esculenta TaxID=4460 RepID=A0A843WQ16_COLES|nr:hypothetical protein [Colocasia esculenta]